MKYVVTINGKNGNFPIKGLNELLGGRIYDRRTKKYRNGVKGTNDLVCRKAIRASLKGVKLTTPIKCTYYLYAKNRMHDRSNLYSSCEKSFLDALQQEKSISNDGWNDVYDSEFHTYLDPVNPRVVVEIEEMESND